MLVIRPLLRSSGGAKGKISVRTIVLCAVALIFSIHFFVSQAPRTRAAPENASVGSLTKKYVQQGRGVGASEFLERLHDLSCILWRLTAAQ